MSKEFVHLHLHTEFSLLDGSGKVSKIIDRVKELGMKSVAITDHGAMYGCVEFYNAAKSAGIKPIIGCEIYVAGKDHRVKNFDNGNNTYHLVLLVKDAVGYQNLMKIVSEAAVNGFYYKPRIDMDYIREHSEGLIALSACLGGTVAKHINKGENEKAKEWAIKLKDIFKDDFYLEVQNHGIPEQIKVNKTIIDFARELDIPLVATNDVHYINKEDYKAHDVLICIQTGKTVDMEDRMRYPEEQFYIRSREEMEELFPDLEEALDNTVKIADMCNYDYTFHESKLPNFPLPEGTDHYKYMRDLCYEGLKVRYKDLTDEVIERAEFELGIIKTMGYVDYFLIVWDFIKYAVDNGIFTGPGRGSAAGSIVAYALGITKIDPLKYSLLFERFLNPERISMPDVDSDFCYERRQDVINYVIDKYGKDCVSQIVTFGTMAARACLRDVGRAMNYSYAEVDKIAKMIPTMLGITIDKALEINPELKNIYETDPKIKEFIDISRKLEGLPRHTSTHAAGVVIASRPLVEYVPLTKNDEAIVAQFPMGTLEELGLLKMDFLGLRTLTVIRDAILFAKENQGVDIDLDKLDLSDHKVYAMIGEGKTAGVFQLESPGMTSFMKDLQPDSFEDIIAGISLYRPGPMAAIPRYIESKKNPDKIKYLTPELEPILDVTYGVMVYQEQVMEIVRKLGGYSIARADLVRRAMSKKKHKVMEEERQNFIHGIVDESGEVRVPGCVRNGISAEIGNKIFDQMMDFASYAFNKSHAAAYALVGYYTGYLMRYYKTEFIAAMLNSVMGNNEKVSFYIRFAKEQGIEVLPPDINESHWKFSVKGKTVRFGLGAIKGVGHNVISSLVSIREEKGDFTDFADFINKIDTKLINRRALESLIKSGAFDSLGIYRSKLLAVYERLLDGASSERKRNLEGQLNLFADYEDTVETFEIQYPDVKEFEKKYILAMEKEITGLYISGHPLDEYVDTLEQVTNTSTIDIIGNIELDGENSVTNPEVPDSNTFIRDGDRVKIGGIISSVSRKFTKKNDLMAFINLQDIYGEVEVIIFPKIFEQNIGFIEEDRLVVLKGRISKREEETPKIICEEIEPLVKLEDDKVYIRVKTRKEAADCKKDLEYLQQYMKGGCQTSIFIEHEKKAYRLKANLWVNTKPETMQYLRSTYGEENIKII